MRADELPLTELSICQVIDTKNEENGQRIWLVMKIFHVVTLSVTKTLLL